jgi:hypothetical protein
MCFVTRAARAKRSEGREVTECDEETYVLCARADDGALVTDEQVTVTVTR